MAHRLAHSFVPVAALATALLAPTSARASTGVDAPSGDQGAAAPAAHVEPSDYWRPRLSAGVGAGQTEGALIAGGWHMLAGIEPHPTLFLGASYRGVRGVGEYDGYSESLDTDVFGGALEIHPLGKSWVDPYLSAEVGYGSYVFSSERGDDALRRAGLAGALGGGLSLRSKYVGGGPQLSYITVPDARTTSVMIDLRVDVRF